MPGGAFKAPKRRLAWKENASVNTQNATYRDVGLPKAEASKN
jgi:hypothetical protein